MAAKNIAATISKYKLLSIGQSPSLGSGHGLAGCATPSIGLLKNNKSKKTIYAIIFFMIFYVYLKLRIVIDTKTNNDYLINVSCFLLLQPKKTGN